VTTNDELVALILPWAKTAHPDKYESTLAVAKNAATFRRYLIRLIEIRWSEEPAWASSAIVPLSVFEESALTMTFVHRPTGTSFEVKGRLAPGPRVWTFAELAMLTALPVDERTATLTQLVAAKRELDLVHVES
jgi:hypothetical protein